MISCLKRLINESTAGADALVGAMKLYDNHMKLYLIATALIASYIYKKWEMIDHDRC